MKKLEMLVALLCWPTLGGVLLEVSNLYESGGNHRVLESFKRARHGVQAVGVLDFSPWELSEEAKS